MSEKEHNNQFRFSLTQEDNLLCERIFDANQFNPFTRNSIDVREILPKIITNFQKVLSNQDYYTELETGRIDTTKRNSKNYSYNLYDEYLKILESYPIEYQKSMKYNPKSQTIEIEDRVIRGVECKIGLYINENPIVERIFYVNGYNTIAKWSVDLLYTFELSVNTIIDKIRMDDVNNIWDDYDLINYRGFTLSQIRELPISKRRNILKYLRSN